MSNPERIVVSKARGLFMATGYRSILRLEDSVDAVNIASDNMRDWLKEKLSTNRGMLESCDWDGQGTHILGEDSSITVVEHDGEDGTRRQLLRFVETNAQGVWRVAVTAHSAPRARQAQQVIVVEVDNDSHTDDRPASERTAPPRIVKQLLNTVEARDYHSDLVLTARPFVADVEDIPALVRALQDRHRNTAIVIAGALPGVPVDVWTNTIEKLLRDSAGTSAAFVLTVAANAVLNEALGVTHEVQTGGVRTFLPGVVPGDREDAFRHRILTARSFADAIGQNLRIRPSLLRVHGVSSRRRLLEQPLPTEVQRTFRVLERAEIATGIAIGVESVSEAPRSDIVEPGVAARTDKYSTRSTPSWLTKLKGIFDLAIGSNEISDNSVGRFEAYFLRLKKSSDSARAGVDGLLDKLNVERDRSEAMQGQLDELELELAIAAEQRRKAERLAQYRGDQLKELHEYSRISDPEGASLDESPESIDDLLDRLKLEPRLSQYIVFTGDADKAVALDSYDSLGRYAAAFWEYLLVLRDYCQEKERVGFSGNIYMYLTQDQTTGRKCDSKRFAAVESDSVQQNPAWRKERLFSVPSTVDPSGKQLMYAHFRPTHSDSIAPRMYIHDDFHNTGKIYVGYIGRHLSNTMTN